MKKGENEWMRKWSGMINIRKERMEKESRWMKENMLAGETGMKELESRTARNKWKNWEKGERE